MPTPAEVVAAARRHLGTPWVHQGRTPGLAIDCAGLVILVARELGVVPPDWDVNGYSRWPDGTMLRWCDEQMQRIDEPELGAVLVLATAQQPQHMGIVGDYVHGGLSVIHACNAARPARVLETRLMFASNFQRRGVYRMTGVT